METLLLDLTAARRERPTVWDRTHRVTLREPRKVVPLPVRPQPRPLSVA